MSTFIGANLPLYPMRAYDSIESDGPIKYISTFYDRYILDDLSIAGDYVQRRLHLSIFHKEHRLYPIGKICNTVAELFNSGSTVFIDNNGKVFHWKKQTYYHIVSLKVLKTNTIGHNKEELFYKLPEGGVERTMASRGYLYVYAIKLSPFCYIPLDFGDEYQKICRKKL